jgi:hypothetical protein
MSILTRPLLVVALVICSSSAALGQVGSIIGRVTDSDTGDPVVGALVGTSPATNTALSGATGGFELLTVPIGSYSVTASKDGFNSASASVSLSNAAPDDTVNFALVRNLQKNLDALAETIIRSSTEGPPREGLIDEEEDFYQLGDWFLIPVDTLTAITAAGKFTILVYDSTGTNPVPIEADRTNNEELTIASDGLHYGRIRYQGDMIEHFEVKDFQSDTVRWQPPGGPGHYHYKIGPGAKTIVGKTAEGHAGTQAARGFLILYDENGTVLGNRIECQTPSLTRFNRDGSVMLVGCRDDRLILVDAANGTILDSLDGPYRNFVVSDKGTYFATVHARDQTVLRIKSLQDTLKMVDLSQPITQVEIMPGVPYGRLGGRPPDGVVVAAAQDSVFGVDPLTAGVRWRRGIAGTSPEVVSMSVASGGLVALGVLLDSEQPEGGLHPAAIEIVRSGLNSGVLLHRESFQVRDPDGRVPIVSLNTKLKLLLVHDREYVRSLHLEPLIH